MYSLEKHGDPIERRNHSRFLKSSFPSYEKYWLKEIIPITNRSGTVFKSDSELVSIGKTRLNCYFAQLHYSVQFHLGVSYGILNSKDSPLEYTKLLFAMTTLLGATDIAFELLQWWTHTDAKRNELIEESKEISADKNLPLFFGFESVSKKYGFSLAWRNANQGNLTDLSKIRRYRDKLVHRGLRMVWIRSNQSWFPCIGEEDKYCEWDPPPQETDYSPSTEILKLAWDSTVGYLERQWSIELPR